MPRPTINAIRRAAVASALGAGVALVGVSLAGMASLDSDLRVASERLKRPPTHEQRVSFEQRQPAACQRLDDPRPQRRPAPASLPAT